MNRKIRTIILLLCAVCFSVAAPVIVAYSMGYRFDFEKMKVVATGGIYVRTFPSADQISINSGTPQKPGFLSNWIFVQSLLPKTHTVSIKKEGYFDYHKVLTVGENEVTKLENVILFKKDLSFKPLADEKTSPFLVEKKPEKYIIKNSSLFYSDSPENKNITATAKKIPLIKGLVSFSFSGNNIVWLGTDGVMRQSSLSDLPEKTKTAPAGQTPVNNLEAIKINKKGAYEIILAESQIFLNNNGQLLSYDGRLENFTEIAKDFKGAKISPDAKNLVFFAGANIYLLPLFGPEKGKKILLYQSKKNISEVLWLNNDYIIFAHGNEILISEIDYRGNINTVTLAGSLALKDPKIIYNEPEAKLYILSGKETIVSDRLIP